MKEITRLDASSRMSEAVMYDGKIYLSGMIADDGAVGASVLVQTRDILSQIDALLARAGTNKTRILKATIWMRDISNIAEMNEAWDAWVVPEQTPARATVQSALFADGYDVEIMVEAAL